MMDVFVVHILYRGTTTASRSVQTKCERAEEQDVVEEYEGQYMSDHFDD